MIVDCSLGGQKRTEDEGTEAAAVPLSPKGERCLLKTGSGNESLAMNPVEVSANAKKAALV